MIDMKKTGKVISCAFCGKKFYLAAWALRDGRKYCSRKCKYQARTEASLVTLTCPVCGNHFKVHQGEINKGRIYCSYACAGQARQRRITLICEQCGQPFERPLSAKDTRFCSRACVSIHSKKRNIEIVKCAHCGQEFHAYISQARRYCSRDCFHKATINYKKTEQYILNRIDKALGQSSSRLLEHTFEWLVNPETGYNLYVDAYYPELTLAVEYNGPYHYKKIQAFDSRYTLEQRQKLDAVKAQLLKKHGVKLLVIKYDEPRTVQHYRKKLRSLLHTP